jgi:ligand-binding sensor domain-containing protein
MDRKAFFREKSLTIIVSILLWTPVQARYADWINYTSGNTVRSLAVENDDIWVGSAGLTRLHMTTAEMVHYNSANSEIPSNNVTAVAVDTSGAVWIGTLNSGLARFDGSGWDTYLKEDSQLPHNRIHCIDIGTDGTIWIGTGQGLVKITGTTWTVYRQNNSDIPDDEILALDVDELGNVWLGTPLSGGHNVHP